MLPGTSKLPVGQGAVKRAGVWIVMLHRNLRAMPDATGSLPICVPRPVTIFQKRNQEFSRNSQHVAQLRRAQFDAASHSRAQLVEKLLETARRIVPILLDLNDIAAPLQEA